MPPPSTPLDSYRLPLACQVVPLTCSGQMLGAMVLMSPRCHALDKHMRHLVLDFNMRLCQVLYTSAAAKKAKTGEKRRGGKRQG